MKKYFGIIFSILFFSTVYAGKNPVDWSISPSSGFPSQTKVGSTYAVSYIMTNNLPFAVPLSITGNYTGGSFSLTNLCNTTLTAKGTAGSTCQVHLSFQPTKVGKSTAFITLAYHKNRVPLPTLSSTASSAESSDKINGQVTKPLPAITYIGTSYPVEFTFVNNGSTSVTAISVNISGFTASTNACTSALAAHSTCIVSGSFSPSQTGQNTLGVTYVYGNNISVPLTTQTNSQNGSGGCHDVSGFTTLPLPTNTFIYANNVIQYTFRNNCNSGSEQLGTVSITSDAAPTAPTLIKGTDTCSGAILSAGSTCIIFVSVIPNATAAESNDLSINAALPYNNSTLFAHATTSEIVNAISNQDSLHTLTFVNQCNKSVWYGFKPVGTPDPTPNPSWNAYQLNLQLTGAAPSTITLQFRQYFGGSIFGRTGCDTNPQSSTYGTCTTANCTSLNNSNGQCTTAPSQPFTVFEENLLSAPASDGVYDISLINGLNIPGEFRSLAHYVPVTSTSNFSNTCGNSAGAIIQPSDSALGVCKWIVTPPTATGTDCTAGTQTDHPSNYYFVPAGADDGCTPGGSCPISGQVCGMSWTPQPSTNPQYLGTPITRHCGTIEGYWTLANWVGYTATAQWGSCNLYNHYSMGTSIDSVKPSTQPTYGFSTLNPNNNPLPASILADMFACQPTSASSCYTSPGTPNVCFNYPQNPYYALNSGYNANITNACGCHDWNNSSTTPASAQTAQAAQCLSFNSLWDSQVYPRILWLKEACPTAYSYQFDDKSSQFSCNVSGQLTAYQITFCPGGKTGAPGT